MLIGILRKWRNGASPSASSSGAKRGWVGATVIIVDDPQHLSSPNWAGEGWMVAWYRGLLGKTLVRAGRIVVVNKGLQHSS